MKGHFTFEYLDGDKKGQLINAMIDPFYLKIPDDHHLLDAIEE